MKYLLIIGLMLICKTASAEVGKATYYTVESCLKEGNRGITASGEPLKDSGLTCAIRSRKFGQLYKVTNLENKKSVIIRHNDYGPGKGPARRGVVVDLSEGAWHALGLKTLKEKHGRGEVRVSVEAVE